MIYTIRGLAVCSIVADRAGRVLEFNEAAEELFGYSRAEAIGELLEDLIIPRHRVDAHLSGLDRYRRTGERRAIGKGRLQLEARRKSGEVFPVEFSVSAAQSAEGEIFVLFIRDLSRRVVAEKELIKARDEAVEGERAKANLLAIMSHEMRTPLNGMLGTLELLDREDVTEKQRQRLDIIRSSGLLLLQHVNKALDVSRADAGKIEPAAEVFSLGDLVSELVESQRAEAEHGGNSISHHVTTDGPDACRGDVALLSQILLNLIGNAIQFTRDGRITVTANRLQHDDLVDFRITDTGIGIADADQNRIFEDFMTLNKSDSGMAGGTGLGLGIARRLVAATGGEIGVESTPGNGSVFWFRAPLPAAPSVPEHRADPKGETAPREVPHSVPTLRVLVVEDNRVNRVVVSELLEQEGVQVDEAHDGAMGVRLAGANSYDLVLMDISMPVLGGVSATREIRAAENPETRVPIVALTAHALPEDIERFRAAGLNDILVKPISRSSVRAILEDVARDKIGSDGEHSDTSAESASALVDRAHLSELAATLGEDRLAPLLEELGIEMERALNMLDSLSESDCPRSDLRIMVHHVAGSAAMLGARGLRSELVAIEEMLLLSDTAGGRYHIASLRAVWDRTQPLLQTCCQRKPA
jgi:PAS domain S-box-containing protein